MEDETENISRKTWNRTFETINKVGYMDGAADGQQAVYQSSFDSGYKQGLDFGLSLGFQRAMTSNHQSNFDETRLRDSRNLNCQICANVLTLQQNVGNLYNTQQEKNNEILKLMDLNKAQ